MRIALEHTDEHGKAYVIARASKRMQDLLALKPQNTTEEVKPRNFFYRLLGKV